MLANMGEWLSANGEAIYGTRPWTIFGEGPTRLPEGGHKIEKIKIAYTNTDIRFTKKSDKVVYAIVMDRPNDNTLTKSFSTEIGVLNSKIEEIELLGSKAKIQWKRDTTGLVISAPESFPTDYAHVYKITLEVYSENDIGGAVEDHVD